MADAHTTAFPELSLGPQDPDSTSELTGNLGTHNKAGRLLVRHARNYPPELRRLLALPLDDARTTVAQDYREEIEAAARSVRGRAKFLKEKDEVVEVSVRRDPAGKESVFALLYRVESGRTARGVISYDSVEGVEENFQERHAAGEFTPQTQSTDASQALVRELVKALQGDRDVDAAVPGADDETRAQLEELQKRLEEAEARAAEAEQAAEEAAAPKPPYDTYEDDNANDVVKYLRQDGVAQLGALGLRQVVDYENAREGGPRKTIVEAAEELAAEAESAPAE